MPLSLPNLPVKEALPELLSALADHARVVLEAPPGAGKTTLVPLALLEAAWREDGRIIVLEPRRLAARAAALRMAQLLGEPVGQTIGYRVRLESAISAATRVEVVTEGILTRMLQDDPALEGIACLVFDEYHERSLQADLGLALALDAQAVLRPDLRILVMSATLDAVRVGEWLQAPVVRSLGRMFPIETQYLPPAEVAAAGPRLMERLQQLVPRSIHQALKHHPEGDVLVFLPGLGEMRRVAEKLEPFLPEATDLHLLHGDLTLAQQQAAINPGPAGMRKIVLSTSIAETSLTIEGVRIVVDSGYARVPRFSPRNGLTSLATVPVSQAAADQRRGRAGRLGPGTCYRLWSTADQHQLPAHLPPEILDADLSSLTLELAIWGASEAGSLKWLNLPPAAAFSQAQDLLFRLGALTSDKKPTAHGRSLAGLGLNPRLGHLVVKGHELKLGATACALAALLTERDIIKSTLVGERRPGAEVSPDLRLRLELLAGQRPSLGVGTADEGAVRRVKEQARQLRQRLRETSDRLDPEATGLLTGFAYPDRLAQREGPGRLRLVTGQRITIPTELFSEAEFYAVAALDGTRGTASLAAPLAKADLLKHFPEQILREVEMRFDAATGKVITTQKTKLGALLLEETLIQKPDTEAVAQVLLQALLDRGIDRLPWSDAARTLRERLHFLHHHFPEDWPDVSDAALAETVEEWLLPHLIGLRSLADVERLNLGELLLSDLSWNQRTELDRLAPTHLEVPTGSRIALDYAEPATPVLAVRLQEVFGLLDTPRIAAGKVTVLMHLLSPGHRPVQVTRDLRSFWTSGYFEVRKDLRGRYPKHSWPEDPLTAVPVRGVKRKGS